MAFLDDGFFHAIQQNPEDDALRLVYSDFLEDQGDESATAHAELIRVQVRLAAISQGTQNAAEEIAARTTRQNELLVRWQHVWLGDVAETLHGWTFRRGLLEAIQADASVYLTRAGDLHARWPTLTVAKLTRAGDLLPELAASPWLAHLRGLDLSNNGIDVRLLAHLTSSRFVGLLQALDLSDNPIGPPGAALLATSAAEELTELHLARCGLWHEGMVALVGRRSERPRPWRRLDLSGNGINRLGLLRLIDSELMGQIEALDLASNPLGDNGASALGDSPNVKGLEDLGLSGTETGDVEVAALAASGNLVGLHSLDLRGHHCMARSDRFGNATGGIAELASSPLLGQLRRLLLGRVGSSNGWTAQVLRPIRPAAPPEQHYDRWMSSVLRASRYLVPSQLIECDLDELWWLGDTQSRERLPSHSHMVTYWLEEYPELEEQMDPSQIRVLRLRYGLEESPKTLAEIAACLGLPRERVREIETKALARLRKLSSDLALE